MSHCVLIPERWPSFYDKLKNLLGRANASFIYNRVAHPEYKEQHYFQFDESGEPTVESVLASPMVSRWLGEDRLSEALDQNKEHLDDNITNTQKLLAQTQEYNKEENQPFVQIVDYDSEGKLTIKTVVNNKQNWDTASTQQALLALNETMVNILGQAGITITELSKQQVAAGRVGLTDFNKAYQRASEFTELIKLANNMEGFNALSEEASHLILGIHRNSPLVARSIDYIVKHEMAEQILGDEYNKVYQFYAQQYDDPIQHDEEIQELVAEEALGKVFREEMINKARGIETAPMKVPLFKRFFNFIVNLFKGINPGTYQNSLDKIKNNISPLVKSAVEGTLKITKEDVKMAKRKVQFNALSSRIEAQLNFLNSAVQDDYKLAQHMLVTKGKHTLKQRQKAFDKAASLKAEVDDIKKTKETMKGIANYCTQASIALGQQYTALANLDKYSEAEQGEILRNVQLTLQRHQRGIAELNQVVTEEYFADSDIRTQNFMLDTEGDSTYIDRFTQVGLDSEKPHDEIDLTGLSPEDAIKEVQEQSKKYVLSDDESSYIGDGKEFLRVTTAIAAVEGALKDDLESLAAWKTPSTNIGTGIDSFVRDFISGKISRGEDGHWHSTRTPRGGLMTDVYPNCSTTQLQTFADQLQKFKEEQAARGITLVSEDLTINGIVQTTDALGRLHNTRVAGSLDLLGYDAKGNWYIFDMKTHRSKIKDSKIDKYQRQLSLYAQLLRQKYHLNVVETNVIPIKVSYPTPAEAGGSTTYTVVPETNQLMANGEVFQGAYPTLEKTIPLDMRNLKFDYTGLLNDSSAGYGTAKDAIQHLVSDLHGAYGKLEGLFQNRAKETFVTFLKKHFGDTVQIVVREDGKPKAEDVPIEEVVAGWEKDSTMMQKWFTSMADNPDTLLQMLDKIYKKAMDEKNIKSIEFQQEVVALAVKYEKRGIKDYTFMFEDDKARYVDKDADYQSYKAAKQAKIKELKERLLEDDTEFFVPGTKEHAEYRKEMQLWRDKYEKDGKPNPEYFPSKYNDFSQAQKDFWEEWMDLKETMDTLLGPSKTYLHNTIKIRKRGIERTKAVLSSEGISAIKAGVKASFKKSFDDANSYKEAAGLSGFHNEELFRLPALYVNAPASELKDLSTDVISTLLAYGDACLEYNAMNDIVDQLELGREVLKKRKIKKTRGGAQLIERRNTGSGQRTPFEVNLETEQSNFYELLNNFLESKIYNRYLKDAGETMGQDTQKLVGNLRHLSAVVQLGFNAAAGISNILNGIGMQNIEAASGEFFNARELAAADKEYSKAVMHYIPDIGSRVMKSKLALMDQLFNIRQITKRELRNKNWVNRMKVLRVFGPHIQFICQTAGDHWLYNRTAIAMMLRYKLKDKYGRETNVWEAFDVVPIDPKNPDAGNKLVLKEGTTKTDGTEFTISDITDLTGNIRSVNQGLFGIYNEEDMVQANQVAWMRLVMQYRDFLPRQIRKRLGVATTNFEMGRGGKNIVTEGFYRSAGRFIKNAFTELREGDKSISQLWDSLETWEKRNIRRTCTELIQLFGVAMLCLFLGRSKPDDPWYVKWAKYLAVRQKTELGAVSVLAPNELLKIVRSPMAATSMVSDTFSLTSLVNPANYFEEVQSGPYEGHSRAYRNFMRSPLTLQWKTIQRQLNIENAEAMYWQ